MTYDESQTLSEAISLATGADASPSAVKQARKMIERMPEALRAFDRTLGEGTDGLEYEQVPGGIDPTSKADPDYDSYDYHDEDVADFESAAAAPFRRQQALASLSKLRRRR